MWRRMFLIAPVLLLALLTISPDEIVPPANAEICSLCPEWWGQGRWNHYYEWMYSWGDWINGYPHDLVPGPCKDHGHWYDPDAECATMEVSLESLSRQLLAAVDAEDSSAIKELISSNATIVVDAGIGGVNLVHPEQG